MPEAKTDCTKCIFQEGRFGCSLGKPIFAYEGIKQVTPGYCRHKRAPDWMITNGLREVDEPLIDTVYSEELGLSAIIPCLDINLDNLRQTIDSIRDKNGMLTEIVVPVQTESAQTDRQKIRELLDYLNGFDGIGWHVDELYYHKPIEPLAAVNYSMRLVRAPWFLSINSGDTLDVKVLEKVHKILNNPKRNTIAFYFEEEDQLKLIGNKAVFWQMDGHLETPWLEKLKLFSNWDDVCLKIE